MSTWKFPERQHRIKLVCSWNGSEALHNFPHSRKSCDKINETNLNWNKCTSHVLLTSEKLHSSIIQSCHASILYCRNDSKLTELNSSDVADPRPDVWNLRIYSRQLGLTAADAPADNSYQNSIWLALHRTATVASASVGTWEKRKQMLF